MHVSNGVGFIDIQGGKAMNKAATERCGALAGAPKDTCVSDAKVKYGMK